MSYSLDRRKEAEAHQQAAVKVLDQIRAGKTMHVAIAAALLAEAQVHATLAVASATLAVAAAVTDSGALAP